MNKRTKMVSFSWMAAACLGAAALSGCASVTSNSAGERGAVTTAYNRSSADFIGYRTTADHRRRVGQNQSFYFDFDRFDVASFDAADIDVQAEHLKKNPELKVRLEGNTDVRGSREYNVALGWKRANAVANRLRIKGVNSNQIAIVSFGKEKPVALGTDEESHGRNRRVDLVFE